MSANTKLPPSPPGPLFWQFLVAVPLCASLFVGVMSQSLQWSAEAFVLVCFGVASLQSFFPDWWIMNVEGDLGLPRFVAVGAGSNEIVVIILRMYCIMFHDSELEEKKKYCGLAIAVAMVVTCGLMGGAFWTWIFKLGLPQCFVPAFLVLSATVVASPTWISSQLAPFIGCGMVFAFVIGFFSASAVNKYHTARQKVD